MDYDTFIVSDFKNGFKLFYGKPAKRYVSPEGKRGTTYTFKTLQSELKEFSSCSQSLARAFLDQHINIGTPFMIKSIGVGLDTKYEVQNLSTGEDVNTSDEFKQNESLEVEPQIGQQASMEKEIISKF